MKKCRHLAYNLFGTPWAITPEKFAEIQAVFFRWAKGERNLHLEDFFAAFTNKEAVAFDDGPSSPSREKPPYGMVGTAAIINIDGTITARPSVFEEYSGGCSHTGVSEATDAAVSDGKVETIIYNIDSPGGVVAGMPEAASRVLAAKKTKPTIAVANHCAASAAYWYMSQCSQLICTPAGQVGCIGVIMGNVDTTEMNKAMGVRYDIVMNDYSPYKSEGYPQVPVTPEALLDMKASCNAFAAMFSEAVAKGRGIRQGTVERDFGKGRTLLANDALKAGMIDDIGTLAATIDKATSPKSRAARRELAAKMVQLGLPTESPLTEANK